MKNYGEYVVTLTEKGHEWIARWYTGDTGEVEEKIGYEKTDEAAHKAGAAWVANKGDK